MHYFICFIISFIILLWVMSLEENLRGNAILLTLCIVVGDGGYYALYISDNLDTAILANNLTYVIGIFAPMFLFFNICDICRIKLPNSIRMALCTFQCALYVCACTAGILPIFYKTIEYHNNGYGAYLTKTYGFTHTIFLITMVLYLIAIVVVAFTQGRKVNTLSGRNIDMIIVFFFLTVGSYMVERMLHLKVELMPFMYTLCSLGIIIPIVKISFYSIDKNADIMQDVLKTNGYVLFNKKLKYMGCNEYALELFPEFGEWEIDRDIPGNGGRFNTFLRPAFMKYVSTNKDSDKVKVFPVKDKLYRCEFSRLHNRKRHAGYMIKIMDITGINAK